MDWQLGWKLTVIGIVKSFQIMLIVLIPSALLSLVQHPSGSSQGIPVSWLYTCGIGNPVLVALALIWSTALAHYIARDQPNAMAGLRAARLCFAIAGLWIAATDVLIAFFPGFFGAPTAHSGTIAASLISVALLIVISMQSDMIGLKLAHLGLSHPDSWIARRLIRSRACRVTMSIRNPVIYRV